jgi:hypothetical protein
MVAKTSKNAAVDKKIADDIPDVDALEAAYAKDKAALEAQVAAADARVEAMLARVAAEDEAKADELSGIEIGIDRLFLGEDPSDIQPYLERAGKTHEPDKFIYRWVSTNPRMYNKRRAQGYTPVPGSITKGDQVACQMPQDLHAKRRAMLQKRKDLLDEGTSGTFESVVRNAGGAPFDGSRSKSDGLR